MRARKCLTVLIGVVLVLSGILYFQPLAYAVDGAGDYIIIEAGTQKLSRITPGGTRTVVYNFDSSSHPSYVAVDSAGNYRVTEWYGTVESWSTTLARITPSGERTVRDYQVFDHWKGVAVDSAGNYIYAASNWGSNLYKSTPEGEYYDRTDIYNFDEGYPEGVAIDSAGNYIVTSGIFDERLSRITPGGVRTVIYNFASGTYPSGVAVDSAGNYIVIEEGTEKLSKITPGGVRTVIYNFASGTNPSDVTVDSAGNYIVAEIGTDKLSKITPGGVRTVIYNFASDTYPSAVAIVPGSVTPPAPEYILDFGAFPAYPYNTVAYYSGGRYVGCGPTTGAMIFGYFQHHFGLTDLLDNPVAGVNEGLDTAWELHYNYMYTGADGFGDVLNIKPGLEDYASDRGHEVQVVAHAPTWHDPSTSWYNNYGAHGDAWLNDGNFWVDLGSDNVGIDVDLFCDFLNAKFSQGITVMLTVDGSSAVTGAEHWVPCVGFERTTGIYYYYDTWTTTLHSADIVSEDEGPGEADFAINFVRTIEYEPLSKTALWNNLVDIILVWPTATPEQRVVLWEEIVQIILLWPTAP